MTGTDAGALEALLERVTKATGPDRGLDGALDVLVDHEGEAWPALYTGSIDAATVLVSRALPADWSWSVDGPAPHCWGAILRPAVPDAVVHRVVEVCQGATPALALIAALLKTLIAMRAEA